MSWREEGGNQGWISSKREGRREGKEKGEGETRVDFELEGGGREGK